MNFSKPRLSIKHLLISNQNWWTFFTKHEDNIREGIVIAIVKLLEATNIINALIQTVLTLNAFSIPVNQWPVLLVEKSHRAMDCQKRSNKNQRISITENS